MVTQVVTCGHSLCEWWGDHSGEVVVTLLGVVSEVGRRIFTVSPVLSVLVKELGVSFGIQCGWPDGLGFFFCPVPEKKALPISVSGVLFRCRDQNSGAFKSWCRKV